MKREHQLSSGLIIRQDPTDCVRPALYRTDIESHPLCTGGGTISLFNYQGIPYGITCKHISTGGSGAFPWSKLVVLFAKDAIGGLTIEAIHSPQQCWGHAVDTDITDVAILKLGGTALRDRFGDNLFVIDKNTVCESQIGDRLVAYGTLYDKTLIDGSDIHSDYYQIHLTDVGNTLSDDMLRGAETTLNDESGIQSLTGLSGGIVFNEARNGIAGIIVRGAVTGTRALLFFIDFAYILPALQAVHDGTEAAQYKKRPSQ